MTPQVRLFAIVVSVVLLLTIVELVRRRRLREEYSWLWMLAGAVIFALSLSYDVMLALGDLFGGVLPSTLLYFFAILTLVAVNIHFSVRISDLQGKLKRLAQDVAILKAGGGGDA